MCDFLFPVAIKNILGNFRVVDFINLDTGMVCCDPASGADVLITFDGGNIWTFPLNDKEVNIADIEFTKKGDVVIIESIDGLFSISHLVKNYYTENTDFYILSSGQPPADVTFPSADTGYICGELYDAAYYSSVFKTVDGGQNWYTTENMYGPIFCINFPSSQVGYGVGWEHRIWKTVDYGESWDMMPFNFGFDVFELGFSLGKVYFFNDTVGFLETGVYDFDNEIWEINVMKTINGGLSWYLTEFPNTETNTGVNDFYCTSLDTCYFITCNEIFKTTNGGGGIDSSTSVPLSSKFEFSIFPNPAFNDITINFPKPQQIKGINTFNYIGEKVIVDFDFSNEANISLLPNGIYFTEIISTKGIYVCKWVKI